MLSYVDIAPPNIQARRAKDKADAPVSMARRVTARAFWPGLLLSVGLSALNCWIEIVANVHFLGGVQMPFGAVFVLSVLALLGWSQFAGISPLIAALFFSLYLGASLIIARLVVEGGLLFPQLTFAPLEVMVTCPPKSSPD